MITLLETGKTKIIVLLFYLMALCHATHIYELHDIKVVVFLKIVK